MEHWQVVLTSDEHPTRLRQLHSGLVHRLIVVSGIIISATKPYIKASKLRLRCRGCLALKEVDLMPGQSPYIPIYCDGQAKPTKNARQIPLWPCLTQKSSTLSPCACKRALKTCPQEK